MEISEWTCVVIFHVFAILVIGMFEFTFQRYEKWLHLKKKKKYEKSQKGKGKHWSDTRTN